jgi:hypothetical protein
MQTTTSIRKVLALPSNYFNLSSHCHIQVSRTSRKHRRPLDGRLTCCLIGDDKRSPLLCERQPLSSCSCMTRSATHFAAHGRADISDPLRSIIYLQDWRTHPLNVAFLMRVDFSNLQLAFLSCCETAVARDPKLREEGLHLAGGRFRWQACRIRLRRGGRLGTRRA